MDKIAANFKITLMPINYTYFRFIYSNIITIRNAINTTLSENQH